MVSQLASIQKFLASAVGMALTVLTFTDKLPFLPATWTTTIGVILGVLTPIATWLLPNKAPAKSAA